MRSFWMACSLLLLGLVSPLSLHAQGVAPYGPLTATLTGKDDVKYYTFTPTSTDPLLFRLTTDDDLEKIAVNVHEDSITGGTVHRLRDQVVVRNATIERTYEIVYPNPAKSYFVEVRNASDGSRNFTLGALMPRPVVPDVGGAAFTTPDLIGKGDVRYYSFKPSGPEPMLFRVSTLDDLNNFAFNIHEDSPTGGTVHRLRDTVVKRGAVVSAIFEVVYPVPGRTYVMEIASTKTENRMMTVEPFETRPIPTASTVEPVTGPDLNGKGDVRYYKFNVNTPQPFLIRFKGTEALTNYLFNVHEVSPTGGTVHRLRDTTMTGTVLDQATFEVVFPDPNKDYYLEVASLAEGPRSFTIMPFEFRPIVNLSGTDTVTGPVLSGKGDVGYYKFFRDQPDPFLIRFQGTEKLDNYLFNVHEDSITGGTVHRLRDTETDADGVTRRAVFEVVYPNPDKFYFLEVGSLAIDTRDYSILPFEPRPVMPITPGQAVDGPKLYGKGDVRYYSFTPATNAPLSFSFSTSDGINNIAFYVHENNPTGGTVHQLKSSADTTAEFEVSSPDPTKNYIVEVTNRAPGIRNYALVMNGALPMNLPTPAGDLNANSLLEVGDVVVLLRSIVQLETLSAAQVKEADVNGDGGVSIGDAVKLLRLITGLYD